MTINRKSQAEPCPTLMTKFPEQTPLAMAYVPYQQWEEPYGEMIAIERGTMFPSLDLPFIGEEAVPSGRKR